MRSRERSNAKSRSSIPRKIAHARWKKHWIENHLRAAPSNRGELRVALTDAADNFLNVARDALQLSFGEIELQPLP